VLNFVSNVCLFTKCWCVSKDRVFSYLKDYLIILKLHQCRGEGPETDKKLRGPRVLEGGPRPDYVANILVSLGDIITRGLYQLTRSSQARHLETGNHSFGFSVKIFLARPPLLGGGGENKFFHRTPNPSRWPRCSPLQLVSTRDITNSVPCADTQSHLPTNAHYRIIYCI